MSSISINDSRTSVVKVYTEEVKTTAGTHYEIRYQVKGNSAGMSGFTTSVKPGSLKKVKDDVIEFVDSVGNKRTCVISTSSVTLGGTGFTSVSAPGKEEKKSKKSDDNEDDNEEKENDSFCIRLIFSIIPILEIYWILKAIVALVLWPFRCIFSSNCDYPTPSYNFSRW